MRGIINYKQPTTLDIEVTRLWTNCYGLEVNNEAHKCLLKNKLVPNGVDSAVMLIFCRTKCVVAFNKKRLCKVGYLTFQIKIVVRLYIVSPPMKIVPE